MEKALVYAHKLEQAVTPEEVSLIAMRLAVEPGIGRKTERRVLNSSPWRRTWERTDCYVQIKLDGGTVAVQRATDLLFAIGFSTMDQTWRVWYTRDYHTVRLLPRALVGMVRDLDSGELKVTALEMNRAAQAVALRYAGRSSAAEIIKRALLVTEET